MSWIPPKTNWTNQQQGIKASDFNRIGNDQRIINDYTNTYRLTYSGLINDYQYVAFNACSQLINVPAYYRVIARMISAVALPDNGSYEGLFWMLGISEGSRAKYFPWDNSFDSYMYYSQNGIIERDLFELPPPYTNPTPRYPLVALETDSQIRVTALLCLGILPPTISQGDLAAFACCDFLLTVEDSRLVGLGPNQ